MTTLRDIITDRKTRKGQAAKITRDGAYWETAIEINSEGGDGIGQAVSNITWYIEVRHYRAGDLRAYINRHSWHQNSGTRDLRTRADDLLECQTIEDLIQVAESHEVVDRNDPCGYREEVRVSDRCRERLPDDLPEMAVSLPAPDED